MYDHSLTEMYLNVIIYLNLILTNVCLNLF